VITCLFLFLLVARGMPQDCTLSADPKLHARVLNLDFLKSSELMSQPSSLADNYLLNLAESLELIVTENSIRFSEYESNAFNRIEDKINASQQDREFLKAETRLQWAFVYLKFGHEFDAALNLREAYQIAKAVKRKFPDYLPIRKTTGLLNVIIGSVPEKYNWVLGMLGMDGSVNEGMNDLNKIRKSNCILAEESELLYALVQGYVLQRPDSALNVINNILKANPNQRLALFLASSLAIKNSQSEKALDFLNRFNQSHFGVAIPYADYLFGEVYLHKGEYQKAIQAYSKFLAKYPGQNYVKDAHYKIGLCHWLNGNEPAARDAFDSARQNGKAESEADKAAERGLQEKKLPNVLLSKARYFTDGGFYSKADSILNEIQHAALPGKRDQTEYYYRKGRVAHKTFRLDIARLFYQQTIDLAASERWYFAPNSCLQMGYILLEQGKKSEAKKYFEKALTYKNHEYKNSIDAKAKSALAQMKKK
jgi:tetratricopeptide (TPR) repeat protein